MDSNLSAERIASRRRVAIWTTGSNLRAMSELRDELLRDIDETIQDVFDLGTRRKAREKAASRRKAYRKGIEEVRDIAGEEQARALAEWIQTEIRSDEQFPSARNVRQRGAELCRERGESVSTGSWLGA